jgi:hypothetical protein
LLTKNKTKIGVRLFNAHILPTKLNTMKKETAQFLAVLVAACYLLGQLQDIYSK